MNKYEIDMRAKFLNTPTNLVHGHTHSHTNTYNTAQYKCVDTPTHTTAPYIHVHHHVRTHRNACVHATHIHTHSQHIHIPTRTYSHIHTCARIQALFVSYFMILIGSVSGSRFMARLCATGADWGLDTRIIF